MNTTTAPAPASAARREQRRSRRALSRELAGFRTQSELLELELLIEAQHAEDSDTSRLLRSRAA